MMKKLLYLLLLILPLSTFGQLSQIDFPLDWDDSTNVDYTVTDFGGNSSSLVADPTDPTNTVLKSEKTSTAQTWAGTTLSTNSGLTTAIPFASGATTITAIVYSPTVGTPIRLKAEDHTDPTITVETEMTTTVANAWDTLVFDFANQAAGTAMINFASTYDKVSIFYDFGAAGATPSNIYYLDDIYFSGSSSGGGPTKSQIDLPLNWNDSANVDYAVTDFGGNSSSLAADPSDPTNTVLKSEKTSAAQTWAGTTLGTNSGFASAIPFASGSTTVTAIVYSPTSGTPIRLKVEDNTNAGISVETEMMTTVANAWDTLVFDFANEVTGTAAINFANTYDKMSIFYDFGTAGATPSNNYYLDDVFFGGGGGSGGGPTKAQIDLPLNWNDSANVDYTVTDFGGNSSLLAADPSDPTNTVLKSEKTSAAQTWAGTTLGTNSGFASAIPFASGATTVTAIVYSPTSGTPIRLKVEDNTNAGISVETEMITTVANAWDTLVFDFANEVTGTAAINFGNTYDKMSIFYDFGTAGATPSNNYYLDDVFFSGGGGSGGGPTKAQIDLPLNWNDSANVDYTVTDFGGNSSLLAADPADPTNTVLKSEKTSAAQTWAGTTLGTNSGFASAIPFASGATTVTAIVYSPTSGIPVRLKVEDHTDPTITVETEMMTTVANAWDTLVFDFANQAAGTAMINFASTYDKMSIFYDFGTGGATPSNTYYLDDVYFGGSTGGGGGPTKAQIDLPVNWDDSTNVDYTVTDFGGNSSTLVADPADPTNTVLKSEKTSAAQTWAGTTLGTNSGFASVIPFASGATTVSAVIYSPTSGIPVRLKVEDNTNAGISVETEMMTTVANAWDTLVFDFANEVTGTAAINFANSYDKMSIFYDFGTAGATPSNNYYLDDVFFGAGGSGGGPTKAQIDLPVNWDDSTNVDYTVTDFGGNSSSLVADPADPTNTVLKSEKTSAAQTWAGTTLGTNSGFASAIPFASGATTVTAIVYSPTSGIPVRLKVEDNTDPTITVETEMMTTVANSWDTLVFDFANQVSGTAMINFANTYDKMSIFYDFGTGGATPSNIYYLDDVYFGGGTGGGGGPTKAQIDLPIDWDDSTNVDYTVIDFGGNSSSLVADPLDPTNTVLKSEKTSAAQTWAGTTLSTNNGLATAIPFASGSTTVTAIVYSPTSGIPVRLKVEDHTDPTITVETEMMTTVANAWDTLVFDFANQAAGTAAINFASTYDKMSIFYDFGTAGATPSNIYYVDDIYFGGSGGGGGGPTKAQIDLPIDWDDSTNVDYTVIDFGGNSSSLVADPLDPTNTVLKSEKTSTAQTWAGTTLSTNNGLATAIPFASGSTMVTAIVYSPTSGIPVRLKVEDHNDPTITVETEMMTTVANAWDTLVFDFSNQAAGTAAINFASTYDKMSIFYDFGTAGATPSNIYYVDDIYFGGSGGGGGGPTKAQIDLPIDWDDSTNVDYTVADFGGNSSSLVADPLDPTNTVLKSEKTSTAQTWAGTTLSTSNGLATAIPFVSGSTTVTAIVYSPTAGIPVRLKVEDHTDPTITVETEMMTTVANAWDTLVFDFANHVTGTAAINFANTYDMMSIFYDFGTAGATPSNTYYVDDIYFGGSGGGGGGPTKAQIDLPIDWDDSTNVDYTVIDFGGNSSALAADPMDPTNMVLRSEKTSTAQTWAGTTLSTNSGLATAIPFASGATTLTAIVYSPTAGIPVRIKAEDHTDPTISVETEVMTTVANAWDTLVFDFANQVTGTAAINFANTYDKISIFYDFGTGGATPSNIYYVDDIYFGGSGSGGMMTAITFRVDLSQFTDTTYSEVNLNGTFNNWCGNCAKMTDTNNDSIFEITVSVPTNDTIEFKYTLDGWTREEQLTPGMSCTKTVGGFTNRVLVPAADTLLPAVCWESCVECTNDFGIEENWISDLSLSPNPSNGIVWLRGQLQTGDEVQVLVHDLKGRLVYQTEITGQLSLNQELNLNHLNGGMYRVSLNNGQNFVQRKIVIAH